MVAKDFGLTMAVAAVVLQALMVMEPMAVTLNLTNLVVALTKVVLQVYLVAILAVMVVKVLDIITVDMAALIGTHLLLPKTMAVAAAVATVVDMLVLLVQMALFASQQNP